MPQTTGGGVGGSYADNTYTEEYGYYASGGKKKKRPDEVLPAEGAITAIEKESQHLIPSSVVWAMTNAGLRESELRKVAKLTARYFDVSPRYMWGVDFNLGRFDDPYSEGPLSLSTFRRLSADADPKLLGLWLPELIESTGVGRLTAPSKAERARGDSAGPRVKAADVSKMLRAIGPVLDGFDLPASVGLAMAIEATIAGIAPDRMSANMTAISGMRGADLTPDQVYALALMFAKEGKTFHSPIEVARAVLPPAVVEQADRYEAAQEAQADAANVTAINPSALRGFGGTESGVLAAGGYGAQASAILRGLVDDESTGNLFTRAATLEKDLLLDQTAFERSFVGRSLYWVGDKLNEFALGMESGVVYVAGAVAAPISAGLEAVGAPGFEDSWNQTFAIRDRYLENLAAGQHLGSQWADLGGLPEWTGAAMDLIILWNIDPFIMAGKGIKAYRGLRVAPELLQRSTVYSRLTDRLGVVASHREAVRAARRADVATMVRGFSVANARGYLEAALGDPGAIRRWTSGFGRRYGGLGALDEPLLEEAAVLLRKKYPTLTSEAIEEAKWVLQAHGGILPPPGSVADMAWGIREFNASKALETYMNSVPGKARGYTMAGDGTIQPRPMTSVEVAEQVIARNVINPMVAARLEVPFKLRPIPGLGGYTLAKDSAVRLLSNNRLGRKIQAIPNIKVGNVLRFNDDPTFFANHRARRWAEFDADELDDFTSRMAAASRTAVPEADMTALMKEMDLLALERYYLRQGGNPEGLKSLLAGIEDSENLYRNSTRAFGVQQGTGLQKGTVIPLRQPLLETQLVDEIHFLDPIAAKKYVNRYIKTMKALQKNLPEELAAILRKGSPLEVNRWLWDRLDQAGQVGRGVVRTWKSYTVPRAGYIGRVILFDESIRWMATGMGLLERVAMTHVDEAIGALAKAATLGTLPKSAARKLGAIPGTPVAKAAAWIYGDDLVRVGDEVIALPRPSQMAYEPLANTTFRQAELLDEMMKRSLEHERYLKSFGSWDILQPRDPNYFGALQHALNNQLGQSTVGRVALEGVVAGESLKALRGRILSWSKSEGHQTLKRLGYDLEELEEWADTVAGMAHGYTAGSKELARLALARNVTLDAVHALPTNALPPIHGPLIEFTTSSTNPFSRFVDFWYDTYVRAPENVINRQPYYSAWKRRAEKAYYGLADDAGVKVTPELTAAIDQASRRFALAQVKQIMFDFSQTTRLGEMVYGAVPFLQPFMEAFQVYGHILMSRNPALIPLIPRLWTAGLDSGFLRRDEASGEVVIPTTWYAGSAAVLNAIADVPGISLLTPANSVNMFFSSSLRLPQDFPLMGGAAIPVPGLAPWAAWPLKEFFANTGSPTLSSWLFQYGPDTPILSSYLEQAFNAWVKPDPNQLNGLAASFVREYQVTGVHQDLSSQALGEQAMKDARKLQQALVYQKFFQIGPTIIRWQHSRYLDELGAMREELGFEEGTDAFLQKYPELTALTTGKTFVAQGIADAESGLPIPNSEGIRIPTSQFTDRFLNSPEGQEALASHVAIVSAVLKGPEVRRAAETGWYAMVAALILESDPTVVSENDFTLFSKHLANGLIKYKTADRFIADVEIAGIEGTDPVRVEANEGMWQALDAWWEYRNRAEDNLRARGLSDDNVEWEDLKTLEGEFLVSLLHNFPQASNFVEYEYDTDGSIIDAEFKGQTNPAGVPHVVVMANIRAFAAVPEIQDFDAVKGLNMYLQGRDEIAVEMAERGITSLDTVSAEDTGLRQRWEDLWAQVVEEHPYTEDLLDIYLRHDLEDVVPEADKILREMRQDNPDRYTDYREFDTRAEELNDASRGQLTDIERNQAFQDFRRYMDSADPEFVDLWWQNKGYYNQEQYVRDLRGRPVVFWSRHDLSLMGITVSNAEAEVLNDMADARIQIARDKEDAVARGDAYEFSSSEEYDRIARIAAGYARDNPGFAAVMRAADTWGWALWQDRWTKGGSQASVVWSNIQAAIEDTQAWADDRELAGINYGTAEERAAYLNRRKALEDYVRAKFKEVPRFRKEWMYVQDQMLEGESLLEWLMPDDYFGRVLNG